MGTGVGEAMIIGAVTGAGTSAITGGDPLKGALLGAAGGGVGAGIAGAGAGAGAATGAGGATTGAATGASAVPSAFNTAMTTATPNAMTALPSATTALGPTQAAAQAGTMATQQAAAPVFPSVNQFYARNPIMMPAGLGATAAAIGQTYDRPGLPEEEEYSGPLSRFRYSPDTYRPAMASGGLADSAVAQRYMKGGHLGSYSDGGRLLKGPGDGMSDSIPAKIGAKQPARLADGEFVVPADVVSGLGNGSTDAGARKLYAMMDKVRKSRTGSKRQGKEINPNKYLPS